MSLTPGTRLGPYEVTAQIGVGGMGEVYQATDTNLGREVAIKVLPEEFAGDPARLVRFEREAKLLASLNHPNIAAIYDLERSGETRALVLELVEGPTLADRIAQGPIPLEDALPIARQIVDALEAAHEQGIIHRDLKPANIKVREDGTVKVLDFGLAKALGDDVAGANPQASTLTATRTREGRVMGTPGYMSPEQARGDRVDRRTDVWAFGCVLYEMVTGRRAFESDDVSLTLAKVLERDPSWEVLPAHTPPRIATLLRRCLDKDPKQRVRDIGDVRLALEGAFEPTIPADLTSGIATSGASWRRVWPWLAVGLLVGGVSAALATWALMTVVTSRRQAVDRSSTHASILLPEGIQPPPGEPFARFALSPDGRRLAFVAAKRASATTLWVYTLGTGVSQPLGGTEGATFPFWSPDSRFIGFQAQGKLKKIDASGGQPVTLCDAWPRAGGTWNQDDVILFTPTGGSSIYRVSAAGGTPSPVTTLDEAQGDAQHWFPFFLPDGRHFLYYVVGSVTGGVTAPRAVYVGSIDRRESGRLLVDGGSNAKYAAGHLLFMRDRTLMAQPFDPGHLELSDQAVPVAEELQTSSASDYGLAAAFTVSESGAVAYQTGIGAVPSELVWFDRAGRRLSAMGDQADYGDLALSPDGSEAVVSVLDPSRGVRDLWLFDVARGVRTRLTFDQADAIAPIWSPDGSRVVFGSGRQGGFDLFQMSPAGTGTEKLLLRDSLGKFPVSWSPDGRYVLYVAGAGTIGRSDLRVLTVPEDRAPTERPQASPFVETRFPESQGRFSPDGRWIAYASTESGRAEVYVAPFPLREGKWQLSTAGGSRPQWRADGKEAFYLTPDSTLMAVAVDGDGLQFEVGAERALFTVQPPPQARLDASVYAVSRDGQRVLVNTFVGNTAPTAITLVLNWTAGLTR